jgi:alpha-L-fucosidase 2
VWSTGEVKGLKARGGFEVDMAWNKGRLTSATIGSKIGGNLRLRTYEPLEVKGVTGTKTSGPNPNPFFKTVSAGKPEIRSQSQLTSVTLRPAITIDIPTEPGGSYTFVGQR